MRVANTHCSCALPMHEYIFLILFVFPEPDGSDESTCGLGPRPQKNRNNRSCNPNKHFCSVRFQTLALKLFGLHRQRKKNCAARASMHVPVEASKRAYNLHRKQKRTKKTCAAVGDRSQLLLNERRKAWRPVPSKSGTDQSKNKPNTSRRLQKSCRFLLIFVAHTCLCTCSFRVFAFLCVQFFCAIMM